MSSFKSIHSNVCGTAPPTPPPKNTTTLNILTALVRYCADFETYSKLKEKKAKVKVMSFSDSYYKASSKHDLDIKSKPDVFCSSIRRWVSYELS